MMYVWLDLARKSRTVRDTHFLIAEKQIDEESSYFSYVYSSFLITYEEKNSFINLSKFDLGVV